MKKKLFLFALAIIPLTSCNIQFTNNPGGSIYSSGESSSQSSSEVSYSQSVEVPEELNTYTITFNSNHTITQPAFTNADEIFDAIRVKDNGEVIESVTGFEGVAYGPSCLVVKTLNLEIVKTFSYSYVTIEATPFYAQSYDHKNGVYIFDALDGALSLNGSAYIQLDRGNNGSSMNVTKCSFETSSHQLNIAALNNQIFIQKITFHY